jgi:hypothetical protein
VGKYEDDNGRAKRVIKLVERYTDFEEITPVMILEFVNERSGCMRKFFGAIRKSRIGFAPKTFGGVSSSDIVKT